MENREFMASARDEKKKSGSGARSAAKRPAAKKPAAKSAAAARVSRSSGTGRVSASSKSRANGQAKPRKRGSGVQENPLARRSSAVLSGDGLRQVSGAPSRPPRKPRAVRSEGYDEYDLPPRRPKSGGGGRGRRRRNRGFGAVNLLLTLVILGLIGVGAWRVAEYRTFAEMKSVVSRQTFYRGTTVDGVDVSEMTLEQALEYWDTQIEPAYRQAAVELDDGTRVAATELGYASDYEDVLTRAWNSGRGGSLLQRYLRASTGNPAQYEIERALYDDALVRQFATAQAASVDAEPVNATVASFDPATYAFQFTPDSEGYRLDQEVLVRDVEAALRGGGGQVSRRIVPLAPEVTLEDVSLRYGMIASAVTNASSSSSNRIENIRLAMSIIDGTRLAPGEQFSFNDRVGERTKSRGFKVATAYSGGTVTEEVGGGICQVSTTLFNAVVKADLRVDERHPHSLTVSYVDLGKDAAVDWENKDLKFTNTSEDYVFICCQVTDDKRLRIGVFGRLLPNGETITVESTKTGETDYETQYQMSFELFTGQTKKIQSGKKGYTAVAYKVRWDAQGNEIERSELCKSRYQATPEIIAYGP